MHECGMCVCVCLCAPMCMCVCTCVHSQTRKNVRYLGTGVTCSCGCWKPNVNPLDEQQELSTNKPSSPQSVYYFSLSVCLVASKIQGLNIFHMNKTKNTWKSNHPPSHTLGRLGHEFYQSGNGVYVLIPYRRQLSGIFARTKARILLCC